MEIHIFKQYDGVRQYFIVYRLCFWKRLSEQTRFLGTVFLCGEFKLENIFSGVNFSVLFICGNLFLRIAGEIAKLEPAKIPCHTVRRVGERVWQYFTGEHPNFQNTNH